MQTDPKTGGGEPGMSLIPPGDGPLCLGAYELRERLGGGGWGSVYAGVYRAGDVRLPVALKVITTRSKRGELGKRALEREIEAVAALDHPHVVRIYDHGRVTEAEAEGTGLVVDAPYFAMEHLTGGTLIPKLGKLPWTSQRRILLGLLNALAHAHARDLIHRDVKPANVLLGKGHLKLADFGLAEGLAPADDNKPVAGTPGFMAPEQIGGEHRRIGPWTDLYAVGCLAYELACRTSIFTRGRNQAETLAEHLGGEPWPLEPREAVPAGFEDWILQMTARDPGIRFQRAADAASALKSLGEPVGQRGTHPGRPMPDPSSPSREASTALLSPGAAPSPLGPRLNDAPAAAPVRADWRGRATNPADHTVNAGLGLYGLRPPPFVGRHDERDALWAALTGVAAERRPRAVVLRGVAGTGKTALARWLVERADEVGAAAAWTAPHDPGEASARPLLTMLERHLRLAGLSLDDAQSALEDDLVGTAAGDEEAADLMRVLRPVGPLPSVGELSAVVRRAAERAARHRPLVIWFDDAQWGRDSLAFADHLMTVAPAAPILLVLTVEEGSLSREPLARRRLDAVLSRPGASTVSVGPLPREHHQELVRGLLGFSGPLVSRIAARTAGSPLFAVQLVADYVHRGLLEPGARGLRLRAGEDAPLPADLASSWRARIDHLLGGLPAGCEDALEVAATLGLEVDAGEWTALTEPRPRQLLVRRLLRQGLAKQRPGGWAFVHGLLREAVVSRGEARATELHARCAELLAAQPDAHPLRLARHLRAAGRDEDAIAPLLAATHESRSRTDHSRTGELLQELSSALDAAGRPEADFARLRMLELTARLRLLSHDPDGAEAIANRMDAIAAADGSPAVLARARLVRGNFLIRRGRLPEGIAMAEEGLKLGEQIGDERTIDDALAIMGFGLTRTADRARTQAVVERRLAAAEAGGRLADMAHSYSSLVRVHMLADELDKAEAIGGLGLAHCRRHGFRRIEAALSNELGEVARIAGEFELAERRYRRNIKLYTDLGYQGLLVAAWNLALVMLQTGRWSEARAQLEATLAEVMASGEPHLRAAAEVELAVCEAAQGHREACARRLDEAAVLLAETGYLDIDIAIFAELTAEQATQRGWAAEAASAWAIAIDSWTRLDRPEAAAAARKRSTG